MNNKERKELSYFPTAIDDAIIEKFGKEVEPETSFHLFGDMNYHTVFKTDDPILKDRINDFIDGYTKGNLELAERLRSLQLKHIQNV